MSSEYDNSLALSTFTSSEVTKFKLGFKLPYVDSLGFRSSEVENSNDKLNYIFKKYFYV